MILKLIPNTHPLLHERVKPCSKDLDRREMSRILKENMMHYEGVGLSANQIGIGERVFIMMLNMETEETITCFNTRIIKRYDDCCASSRFNSGILAEFEKKSTFGNFVKLNLKATPDRKFLFPTCLKNGELVIIFLIIYCL